MSIDDYLQRIKSLRDDYNEEIPPIILHSIDAPRYKVRKAWFQLVAFALSDGLDEGYLPLKYKEKFYNRNEKTRFHSRNTIREDIDYANGILNSIIYRLSKK